jgi:signal transduction histidine kinase
LKEILLLSHKRNSLLYFEIVNEEQNNDENTGNKLKTNQVVELKIQKIKFEQADSIIVKISSIDQVVQGEQYKSKITYQEALTATVSHEQMTPLNSILNLTEMLMTSSDTSQADKDTLHVILSSAKNMKLMN